MESAAIWRGETPLVCLARNDTVRDCASFTLAAPSAQRFEYRPGQFISLGVEIDGRTHWRAYSIDSSPSRNDALSITVKRVAGGKVSNWLLDHWRAGMPLPALAPAGEFGLPRDLTDLPRAVAFFSAGSGITPMMSMTRWLLENQCPVEIHFFHSARSESDLLFADELQALAAAHPQLHLHLFLTRPEGRLPCHAGRLGAAQLRACLPEIGGVRAWLCGQADYMDSVSAWLAAAGVAPADIHRESFFAAPATVSTDAVQHAVQVPAFGVETQIAEGELLLDVLERAGVPIIGACRTGVCGSCKCKVEGGAVATTSTVPLTPEEVADSVVLACSSTVSGAVSVSLV